MKRDREAPGIADVFDRQQAIIRIQSDVIDELFLLLLQHINAAEADALPVINKINEAAKLRAEADE